MTESFSEKVQLFKSIFKGREDVFAVRWELQEKSGYMPAYYYDPYLYRAHKMKGGSFKNYNDKSYLKLTDDEIAKHLNGVQHIGIYSLLPDNTSWFLAADFDKENWIDQCKRFINACSHKGIPAYLERSRSGNGGHVWIFFEQPYPAVKSRKIFVSLLEEAGIISIFDKTSSFDRLFPNQDFLSGKGLGNLIALPLFKHTWQHGNNCFVDIETIQSVADQWEFLKNIKRTAKSELDKLYQNSFDSTEPVSNKHLNGNLQISLNNDVRLSRRGLPIALINFLREELNFANSEFIIKKKLGKNTFGTERYFRFVEETASEVIIPRGFIGRLIRFCRDNKIEHDFTDKRKKLNPVIFSFNAQLREHQKPAFENILRKDIGIIVAPPGSGKTVLALKVIAEKQQPTLIIVHRKQLLEQWIERIETFLGIPKIEIGKIGQGKNKVGAKITIATIQSLSKIVNTPGDEKLQTPFGTIIVDECHHVPAETFRNTISKLHSFYLYGLTATPFRKYNDGKLIFCHLGEMIAEIKPAAINNSGQVKIHIKNTMLEVPFNPKTDSYEVLSKILVHDSARNKLILDDVQRELNSGKKIVIITERKEHIDSLYQYLKQSFETIALSGEDSEGTRASKWKFLKEGNYQVLITTGQLFGEGTDLQNANCLFLVYPFSFKGKLIQYIGRVQRSELTPTLYDYRDIKIDYLNKLFLKRNTYYRKIEKQASLFDEPTEDILPKPKIISIEKKIKVPLALLEFRYGSVAFKYYEEETKSTLKFEIENLELRSEFEVLKPYFEKFLKSKSVSINIYAEFENEKLIAQNASSNDIDKINNEIIEGVKFRFLTKIFTATQPQDNNNNLLSADQLQKDKGKIYNDGNEILEDMLKGKDFKHSKHLQYLAGRHDGEIMKIRFVLSPFSFVFLLSGLQQHHVILETLDTEEATYLWHIDKSKQALIRKVKEIDEQLGVIRNNGRQAYLESSPQNFSRVLHDYSDERKGFVIWKDLIEEQII